MIFLWRNRSTVNYCAGWHTAWAQWLKYGGRLEPLWPHEVGATAQQIYNDRTTTWSRDFHFMVTLTSDKLVHCSDGTARLPWGIDYNGEHISDTRTMCREIYCIHLLFSEMLCEAWGGCRAFCSSKYLWTNIDKIYLRTFTFLRHSVFNTVY